MGKTFRFKDVEARYAKERQRNVLAKPGVHDCILVLDGLKAGFNVAKIFRSAEAFGAAEVQLINIGPFDPAPACGSFRKVPARFYDRFEQSYEELIDRGYQLFMLDPAGEDSLLKVDLPQKAAFVFGHEEIGFSFDPAQFPAIKKISIPQFGQVESLNVSVAASITLFEYVRQHSKGQ